jgi:formylglycine-generating enzyme
MKSLILVLAVAAVLAVGSARSDVFNMTGGQTSLQVVTVGDAGNPADSTGYGSVGYVYQMGKYDVTNAQYAEFLNAKATSGDPYGLWHSNMSSDANGGIRRSGTGTYTYTVKPGQGNQPVANITWLNAIRFVNWLNNGQGISASTEVGSYTLLGGTPTPSNWATITRNPEAQWVLPTENEWYKAAYYKGGTNAGYWDYPTQSDTAPTWVLRQC